MHNNFLKLQTLKDTSQSGSTERETWLKEQGKTENDVHRDEYGEYFRSTIVVSSTRADFPKIYLPDNLQNHGTAHD